MTPERAPRSSSPRPGHGAGAPAREGRTPAGRPRSRPGARSGAPSPTGRERGRLVAAAAGVLLPLLAPLCATAQGVRGTATTTFRYIELRPLVEDTVGRSRVTEGPDGRLTFRGSPVTCDAAGRCTFVHSPSTESAMSLVQDVRLTSWGFGVEGLSASVQLRGREEIGGDFIWPRADEPFDLVEGYVQYNRDMWRVRLGRQRTRSGLGFDSFDGLDVMAEPTPWLTARVFGGRSLARGLHEPRNDALEGVEDFLLDRDAFLLGASAGVKPEATTSVTLRYQREIWDDRAALLSERASADFRTGLFRPVRVTGSLDYDFAFARVGKAHVTAQVPLLDGDLTVEATGRRYVPYFELWTIWGLFNPVAYHEGRLRTTWSPLPRLGVWAEASYRKYDDAGTSPILGPLDDDAYRFGGGARWKAAGELDLGGSYEVERSAGAFLSTGELSARWRPFPRLDLSFRGMAAQQIEEFRLGEGMVAGGGLRGSYDLRDDLQIAGGAMLYRRFFENRPAQVDWNQVRAWTSLRVRVGSDPGLRRSER